MLVSKRSITSLPKLQPELKLKVVTPPSLIGKVIDKLKEVKYFNKLDLIWDYNNI